MILRLARRLRTAVRLSDGVWQSEAVGSPFLLGFLRPRIYLPYGLEGARLDYVLAHERFHIARIELDMQIVLAVVDSQYDDEFAENFDAFIVARPNEAAEQIASFVNLLKNDGLVPISFVDFQTIFAGLEKKNMLVAIGEGPNANAAAKKVIESIDYEDQISESTGVAFQICGASDRISMIEIGEVSTNIADASNDAEIVWGAQVNNGLGDTIYVTILAVGIGTLFFCSERIFFAEKISYELLSCSTISSGMSHLPTICLDSKRFIVEIKAVIYQHVPDDR